MSKLLRYIDRYFRKGRHTPKWIHVCCGNQVVYA